MAGADTIMTQTLPTIVGAGVVSRTTETMFGRGGRRRKAKSKKSTATVGGFHKINMTSIQSGK